jgi:FkbM family methyltransferase
MKVMIKAAMPWRRLLGQRVVRRHVQGVDLYMPWAHLLPDFAKARPWYGQNLVDLAGLLGEAGGEPLLFMDIGANIGDSTVQILHRVDGRALCVEGDPYWAVYLHRNVDGDTRVVVEEALLTPEEMQGDVHAVRSAGTTTFREGKADKPALPFVSVDALRAKHPDFDRLRLVKSDTDGFDPALVAAVATTWRDAGPVLFFEFDPILARGVGNDDPHAVWKVLADLGYSRAAVWDNTGDPLGYLDMADVPAAAAALEPRPMEHGFQFWDIALCRGDDAVALAALEKLMPQRYDLAKLAAGR